MDEATYGGISRSDSKVPDFSYNARGGCLTVQMIDEAFAAIERQDKAEEEWQREFYAALHPHIHLATSDPYCYWAIYRILQSSRAPMHPKDYEAYMGIVKSRGIEL